jgi:nucleoside-diphosphate-sugar epimerase
LAGNTVFGAALAGKTVRWPGSLDTPHQFNYLPDLARGLVTLGERDEADGEVWHLPAAEPITGRRFIDLVSSKTGRPVKASATPRAMMRAIGLFSPFIREVVEPMYQFEKPFYADTFKYETTFGPFEPTPHEDAIVATTTWFRKREGL